MRTGVEVSPAEPQDVEHLAGLCLRARSESSLASQICSADQGDVARQIGALTGAPGGVVLTARLEGTVVGLLLARVLGPSPFTEEVSLAVEAVYVDAAHRRRGVGHALMVGATHAARQAGAESVYAAPIPGARGMQRFFVRLGFTPAAAHRVVSTSALERRLAGDVAKGRVGALEDLIARRRRLRLDGQVGHVPDQVGQASRAVMSTQVSRAVQTRLSAESTTTTS
ncbi:GNAT family N-acetyltransferase [Cellulomonas bogoriensis]|uniref:GCN5 family acetyltransferase n=1 Tax=Cellulomonas bogoriensis 69B4 = DSM 16987 TaxID=1386082 RepID=A0A0A0C2P9_9CELL|nr:GNAT family N-acetyltransferase [Cellulomonas bogoriensis]KGM14466.1 GCN5 family acetyltransferase [Cellulomonas bogoriensis 69B4 = DSM 16987]